MARFIKPSFIPLLGIAGGAQIMVLFMLFTSVVPLISSNAAAPKVHITPSSAVLTEGVPTKLYVPRLNLTVHILPGVYNADLATWTLNKTAAQYDTKSVLPNNLAGNTYIYGHNNYAVFKQLPQLQPGDTVEVTTSNEYVFTYTNTRSFDTHPSDVSAVAKSVKPQLTLQTCVGDNYELRRLFYLDFTSVRPV